MALTAPGREMVEKLAGRYLCELCSLICDSSTALLDHRSFWKEEQGKAQRKQ
jgi:hypothetical protein